MTPRQRRAARAKADAAAALALGAERDRAASQRRAKLNKPRLVDIRQYTPTEKLREPERASAMAAVIAREGYSFPPVIVTDDRRLLDGHHRARAAMIAARSRIPAIIVDGTEYDRTADRYPKLTALAVLGVDVAANQLTQQFEFTTGGLGAALPSPMRGREPEEPENVAQRLIRAVRRGRRPDDALDEVMRDPIVLVKQLIQDKQDALQRVGRQWHPPDATMRLVWLALEGNAASRIYNARRARYAIKRIGDNVGFWPELSHALRQVEIEAERELSPQQIADIHRRAEQAR